MNFKRSGKRPAYSLKASNIPEAWEKAMKLVWEKGEPIETQYDHKGDPPSRDARVEITITDPFAQPRFHRKFSDGLGGMAEYVQEVVNGAHDYWLRPLESIMEEVRTGKKVDTKWIYTYHKRLFANPYRDEQGNLKELNQIEIMAEKLAKDPHSRRQQAITWVPFIDAHLEDPPCLQRVWARIFPDEKGNLYLNLDTDWRSRDLFKAWFENTIALTTLQKRLADRVSQIRGEPILVGPYTDSSNSLHIYGSYFKEIKGKPEAGIRNYFEELKSRPFFVDDMGNATCRTYTSEQVREFFVDDGVGKGLINMLKREAETMPSQVQELVKKDLEGLRNGSYLP